MALSAGFEDGANGGTVVTTSAGDNDSWNAVSIGAGGAYTYSNAHVFNRTLAGSITTGGAAVSSSWVAKFGTLTDHYGRMFLYRTANPPATGHQFMRNLSVGTAQAFMSIASTGRISCRDAGAGTATSTNAIAVNQWIRIEWHVLHSATVGIVECKLFNTATSTTATETITLSSANTGTSSDRIFVGNFAGGTDGPFWMDGIRAADTAYPGPNINRNNFFRLF